LEYGPQLRSARTIARDPAEVATPATSVAATDPLEISFFDQPRPLPEIVFTDADERARSLTDFRGRVVLLNLWATWCVPCRKEMPALDRLQATVGPSELLVLPLSMDRQGAAVVKPFYAGLGLKALGIYIDEVGPDDEQEKPAENLDDGVQPLQRDAGAHAHVDPNTH
jgi:thiol-disulfide isomerase/thioredoxin